MMAIYGMRFAKGGSRVKTVNGRPPDQQGNVELDVGVKTINGIFPTDGDISGILPEAPSGGAQIRRGGQWVTLNEELDEGDIL